jgi:hypothetical protein
MFSLSFPKIRSSQRNLQTNIAPIPTANSPNSDLITILKESSFLPVSKFDQFFTVEALLKQLPRLSLVCPDIVPLPKRSPVFIEHQFME